MNVFDTLIKEHQIFKKLLKILETCLLEDSENSARAEIKKTLDVLLPALEAHEEIEEAILGTATYATEKKARKGLDLSQAGHKDLRAACASLMATLQGSNGPSFHQLAFLVHSLVGTLRSHFETEEKELWPHYRRSWPKMDFPHHRLLTNAIDQRIAMLERDILRLQGIGCHA